MRATAENGQPYQQAETALDFASCIGCGACVAACPNGAAMLFAGAKLAHLALMPQGAHERSRRARQMGRALDEHFGDDRSEERRVGKEGRSRWSPYH